MKRKRAKATPRIPAKPLRISVEAAARAFNVPERAIEVAQKIGELPRALTLPALIKWRAKRGA